MNLAAAQALALMGKADSWDGHGGKALRHVPDSTLRKARAFFKNGVERPNARTREQVQAIDLILEDREAHNPQARLAL